MVFSTHKSEYGEPKIALCLRTEWGLLNAVLWENLLKIEFIQSFKYLSGTNAQNGGCSHKVWLLEHEKTHGAISKNLSAVEKIPKFLIEKSRLSL